MQVALDVPWSPENGWFSMLSGLFGPSEVLARCFSERLPRWSPQLSEMIPSYGKRLSESPELAKRLRERTQQVLGLA